MTHVRDKVDTRIRHVGANLGHDKWIQVQCVMVPSSHSILFLLPGAEPGPGPGQAGDSVPHQPPEACPAGGGREDQQEPGLGGDTGQAAGGGRCSGHRLLDYTIKVTRVVS